MGDGVSPPLVEHTHNDYLQWLVEFGIIGTLLFVTPPLMAAIQILRSRNLATLRQWITGGLLAVLLLQRSISPLGTLRFVSVSAGFAALVYATSKNDKLSQVSSSQSSFAR